MGKMKTWYVLASLAACMVVAATAPAKVDQVPGDIPAVQKQPVGQQHVQQQQQPAVQKQPIGQRHVQQQQQQQQQQQPDAQQPAGKPLPVKVQRPMPPRGHFAEQYQSMRHELMELRSQNSQLRAKVNHLTKSTKSYEDNYPTCYPHVRSDFSTSSETYQSLFAVGLGDNSNTVDDNEVLIWDRVRLNVGNFYNPTTGVYTVPFDGTYRFAVQKRGEQTSYSPFWIVVNNQNYFFSGQFSPDSPSVNCASVDIPLTIGQTVSVRNVADTTIYGIDGSYTTLYSWFTGYLIPDYPPIP